MYQQAAAQYGNDALGAMECSMRHSGTTLGKTRTMPSNFWYFTIPSEQHHTQTWRIMKAILFNLVFQKCVSLKQMLSFGTLRRHRYFCIGETVHNAECKI